MAEDVDAARRRSIEADDRAQQHGLAGAGAADDTQNLAAPDIEVEAIMHRLRAKPRYQPAHPNHDIVLVSDHHQIFKIENRIENAASATMTTKIDSTTD